MKKATNLLLGLTLALALGCNGGGDGGGGTETGEQALREALPTAETMTIHLPSSSNLVPEQAMFYKFTRNITLGVNGWVRNICNLIEDVVELPPTETDGETYAIWGPHTDALSPATWRVRVDRVGEGAFDFVVEGWPKAADAADAVTVLEGHHQEGDGPQRGNGHWTYHLTAGHGLDPISHDSVGDVAVAYDMGDARALEVRLTDVQGPHDPMTNSALYRYTDAADQSGTFDFVSNMDIHQDDNPDLDRRELLLVRSRWLPTGPGRADVHATHGDLPAGTEVDLIECWDDAFVRTYVRYGWTHGEPTEDGDAAECAYADAQLPQFDDFDPDAFADDDLVAAIPEPEEFEAEAVPVEQPADDAAIYFKMAKSTVDGLSKHVGGVLGMIKEITRNPPSDCEPEQCVWGPWTDWDKGISFKLTVVRDGEAAYTYAAQAKRFGEPEDAWRSLVEGGFTEAAEDGDGQGWFVNDLTVVADLNPEESTRGSFRAEYAREAGVTRLAVRIDDIIGEDNPDEPLNGRYYLEAGPDGGSLDYRFPADIDQDAADAADKQAKELLESRVRWIASGAGVGVVRVTAGDVPEGQEYLGVQCWDATATETHSAFLPHAEGAADRPEIDADACEFDDWQDPVLPAMGDEVL